MGDWPVIPPTTSAALGLGAQLAGVLVWRVVGGLPAVRDTAVCAAPFALRVRSGVPEGWLRSSTIHARLAPPARIVLLATDDLANVDITARVDRPPQWRGDRRHRRRLVALAAVLPM